MPAGHWTHRLARVLLLPLAALATAGSCRAQDALRGKLLYHDVGRLSGAGVSCIDCHGGMPGGLHGIGRAAGRPAVIEEAIGAIHQMAPLRGRLGATDLADLAAYLARPSVPSPDLRPGTVGPDGRFLPGERVAFEAASAGAATAATARIVNAGSVAVRLRSGPRLAGPDAALFGVDRSDCVEGLELAPGRSCSITVAFRASGAAPGLRSASLAVDHDWIGGGTTLALIGRSATR